LAGDLKGWLQQNSGTLVTATLHRAPNMLPDEHDLAEFLNLLAQNIGQAREKQLSAVQFWALTSIGHDAPAAYDWLTVLRVLKEEIGYGLDAYFLPADALRFWHEMDDLLTYHMVQLRRQKERFERSKSNFITVAAHELKTPLTILEGYANMVRVEIEPDSRLRIYIDGMANGIQRMHEIINDMIDVSLIDLQSVELKAQPLNVERVLLLVADNLDKFFAERRVDLIVMPFSGEYWLDGDAGKLAKAFNKVILNALKYTPDGGRVTVSGRTTQEHEVGAELAGYLDIQVRDTGIGINAEDLETIFEKFGSPSDVSLHSSSKTKFKGGGPGLGLPIAKGIIEAHGGRMWAESPGCDETSYPGSTFHIELPVHFKKPDV
jgi:signal transduction histidine kinase